MKNSDRIDWALLLLRVGLGLALCLGHGLMKMNAIAAGGGSFPDPLGLGPLPSALCSMAAECGASLAVAVGLFTRLMALPVIFTMAVICLLAHPGEPWLNKEPSALYGLAYAAILVAGPGRYSLDALWAQRRRRL